MEFFAFHRQIVGLNSMYFPSATIEMIGYLAVTLTASFILRWVEAVHGRRAATSSPRPDQPHHGSRGTQPPRPRHAFDEQSPEYRERLRQSLKNSNGRRGGPLMDTILEVRHLSRASARTRCSAT